MHESSTKARYQTQPATNTTSNTRTKTSIVPISARATNEPARSEVPETCSSSTAWGQHNPVVGQGGAGGDWVWAEQRPRQTLSWH